MQEELEGSVRKCVQDIEHSKTLEDSEWNEVVKKHIDNKLFTVQEQMNKVQNTLLETREMTAEQRDKESRRNNIVLYKVPESDAGRAEDRNKDDISVVYSRLTMAYMLALRMLTLFMFMYSI